MLLADLGVRNRVTEYDRLGSSEFKMVGLGHLRAPGHLRFASIAMKFLA